MQGDRISLIHDLKLLRSLKNWRLNRVLRWARRSPKVPDYLIRCRRTPQDPLEEPHGIWSATLKVCRDFFNQARQLFRIHA